MVGAPRSPRRPRLRRAGALTLVAALAAASPVASVPALAQEDAPARAWRTIKRVPGQVGSATRRAYRELEQGVTDTGRRRRPAAAPAPAPAATPELPEAAEPAESVESAESMEPTQEHAAGDPALDPLFDPEPVAGAAPRPARPAEQPSPAQPAPAAPEPGPTPFRDARDHGTGLRRAALLGAFASALAGVGLTLRRRRQPAAAPVATAPPPPLPPARPPATVPFAVTADALPDPAAALSTQPLLLPDERTTRAHTLLAGGFEPTALDARTEAALADALARNPDERPTPFPGGGRYELIAQIGRGGMGVVYQARDKRLDRIVALKRLPENLQAHPRAVQLLLREARSAARLNHPHIVTVYDVDHEDGAYFLTMEYLDGHPLSVLLHRRGRFAAAEAAWLGRQAAAGLAYAHERRIVHRDVKTANLFLTRDRVLKIMDFGLAKMIEAVRRRATRIGGTPDYMAPEQTLGLEVDGRADLYALGVTLFELLTGTVPFEDGDTMRHHRETPPPDLREHAPDVPEALAALVRQLLAKKPDERPASASEVAERLRAIELAAARSTDG